MSWKKSKGGAKSGETTKMGVLGHIGLGAAVGVPIIIALTGDGKGATGAIEVAKTGNYGGAVKEFFDIMAIEYAGVKTDGSKYGGDLPYTGEKMALVGGVLVLVDYGLGKVFKGKKPVIPFVNIPLVRGRAKRGWG